jgi:hypothetical protein
VGFDYKSDGPVGRNGVGIMELPWRRSRQTPTMHLSTRWRVGAGVVYFRLIGEAAQSPIVSDRGSPNQWILGAGAMYLW